MRILHIVDSMGVYGKERVILELMEEQARTGLGADSQQLHANPQAAPDGRSAWLGRTRWSTFCSSSPQQKTANGVSLPFCHTNFLTSPMACRMFPRNGFALCRLTRRGDRARMGLRE